MLNFKADFDRDVVPVSFLKNAAEWYLKSRTWWKAISYALFIYLVFVVVSLFVSVFVFDFWIDTAFPVIFKIFWKFVPITSSLLYVLGIIFFENYFQFKKIVIVAFLKKEISEIESITKSTSIEEYDEKLWVSLELSIRKNLLINHFSSLDFKNQEKYQDKFLDLLNEMNERFVYYQSIPLLLQPKISQLASDDQKIVLIYLHQLFTMKRILKSISD